MSEHVQNGPCCRARFHESYARNIRPELYPMSVHNLDERASEIRDLAEVFGCDAKSEAFKAAWWLALGTLWDDIEGFMRDGPSKEKLLIHLASHIMLPEWPMGGDAEQTSPE